MDLDEEIDNLSITQQIQRYRSGLEVASYEIELTKKLFKRIQIAIDEDLLTDEEKQLLIPCKDYIVKILQCIIG